MQPSNSDRERRANQRAQLLALLEANSPDWVPIHTVLDVAGFQYGARIFELRRLGHRIENDPGRAFRLIVKSASPGVQLRTEISQPVADETDRLFPDDAPLRHLDLG